ncbi:MAG: hypothetical protein IH991_25515, partial [Planctomycetes bacterium]|nr:hypothetical protein [Planctomycetota bacterium]
YVAFLGVTDLNKALDGLKKFVPGRENMGKGVIKLIAADGQSAFVKQQGKWAFLSQDAASLTWLPMNPAALIGAEGKNYNVAVQVKADNVPKELKAELVTAMRDGFNETADLIGDQAPDAAPFVKLYGPAILKGLEQLITETDTLTYGLAIDQERKSIYLDASFTAIEGTEMAKEFASLAQLKSRFSGFAKLDAAASLNITSQMAEADAQMLNAMLTAVREPALAELSSDANLSKTEKAAATEVLGTVFDVLQKTIDERKFDGGAALLLGDGPGTMTFVAGGQVGDGSALDKALRTIVEFGKAESPELKAVKFDADQHSGVRFHLLTYDVPEDNEGHEVFGDSVEMAVGVGPKSVYFAFGRDTITTLKKAIDASANSNKAAMPFKLTVALGPLVKFGAAVSGDGDARELADAFASFKGNDRIELKVTGIERGMRARIEFHEGALMLIGKTVQKAMQQQGGFPGLP